MAAMSWTIVSVIVLIYLPYLSAQLPIGETVRNVTECDLVNNNINMTCGQDEMIAIKSLHFAYAVRCDSICCTHESTDCFELAPEGDNKDIRRQCSGRSSCSWKSNTNVAAFCSLGTLPISYVYLQYYCIPKSRIMSICDSGSTLQSNGDVLYITNPNYPGITTGSTSCSCSLETYSCESNIDSYFIDADLYLDTNNCHQAIDLKNGTGTTLVNIGCENYYDQNIPSKSVSSHYIKIDFINNSTANQEGLFFIGLKASKPGTQFNLSCTSQPETWCIGCGVPQNISNGYVKLTDNTDTANEATANVTCISGYETNTSTIKCLANGSWEDAICTENAPCTADQWRCTNGDCIPLPQRCDNFPDCSDGTDEINCDSSPLCPEGLEWCRLPNGTEICVDKSFNCGCGPVNALENGNINLQGNSTIGAVADVTCDSGYVASASNVTCLNTGQWESAVCTGVDCGLPPPIPDGDALLTDATNTTYGATATVNCQTGYDAILTVIKCQESKQWETAICTIKDCGPVPTVENGNVVLNDAGNTTFGSQSSVICKTGYVAQKDSITCLSSGHWETPNCVVNGSVPSPTTPPTASSESDKSSPDILLIVILVIVAVIILVQMVISIFFQCKIYHARKRSGGAEILKRIGSVMLGSFPLFGIIFIVYSWRKDIYHDERSQSGNATNNSNHDKDVDYNHIQLKVDPSKSGDQQQSTEPPYKAATNPTYDGTSYKSGDQQQSTEPPYKAATNPTYDGTSSKSGDKQESPDSPNKAATNPTSDGTSSNAGDKQETSESPNKAATNPTYGETSSNSGNNGNSQIDSVAPESTKDDADVLNGTLQTMNPIPTTTASKPMDAGARPHDPTGATMTRGISTTFNDERDDMSLDSEVPVPPKHLYKPKLPPIKSKHEEHHDHHHHHFSREVEKQREKLKQVADAARKQRKHADFVRGDLYIDNVLYRPDSLKHMHDVDHHPNRKPTFY